MQWFGSIYVVTNTVTGERYVGQTRRAFRQRWAGHVYSANSSRYTKGLLSSAMRQYGIEQFVAEEVFFVGSKMDLDWAEKYFIAELKPEYNKTAGGAGGVRTTPYSQSEIEKRSRSAADMWKRPEIRTAITTKIKQKYLDPVYKEHIRSACIGRKMPQKAIDATRKSKYKPTVCLELGITFLSRKFAAEYISARHTTISEAIKYGRKVFGKYTFASIGAVN